jgi:hypothetical protein
MKSGNFTILKSLGRTDYRKRFKSTKHNTSGERIFDYDTKTRTLDTQIRLNNEVKFNINKSIEL